jgi:hypothetical protein
LHPIILLNTLFSNTLSICPYLDVRDQVSHPQKTTGKILVTRIFILYVFRQEMRGRKVLNGMVIIFPRIRSYIILFMSATFTC